MIDSLHILASDTFGIVAAFVLLLPLVLLIMCPVSLIVNRGPGRGTTWGLVIALVPAIGGALVLFILLTTRGGAPTVFYLLAALPMLIGLRSIMLWRRPRKDALRGFEVMQPDAPKERQ